MVVALGRVVVVEEQRANQFSDHPSSSLPPPEHPPPPPLLLLIDFCLRARLPLEQSVSQPATTGLPDQILFLWGQGADNYVWLQTSNKGRVISRFLREENFFYSQDLLPPTQRILLHCTTRFLRKMHLE